MRIGLLGGTFNPIHNGHLALAEAAMSKIKLDKVIFIPAYMPPHKTPDKLAGAKERYRMMQLAIGKRAGFEILRFEIDKKEKSYSIETLEYLKKAYPKNTEFYFLVGADLMEGLDKWKDVDKLLKLCHFAVCNRPNFSMDKRYANMAVESFDMKAVDVSSTQIRKRVRNKQAISGLLPLFVEDYIIYNKLYK
jgi:nicotinate-nucleotide adenylyltransferase